MKYIVLDFETSNYNFGSAFDPRNFPVAIVLLFINESERKIYKYHFLNQKYNNCTLLEIASVLQENVDVRIVGHRLVFDIHWLNRLELIHGDKLFDTMFLPYLEREGNIQKGTLALEFLSQQKDKLGDILVHKYALDPSVLSPKIILDYCVKDVLATEKLYLQQRRKLCRELQQEAGKTYCLAGDAQTGEASNIHQLMVDLLPVIIECEGNGFKLDKELLQKIYDEQLEVQNQQIDKLLCTIKSEYGLTDFNPNSHEQIAKLLYSRELIKEKKLEWANFFENFNQFREGAQKKYLTMIDNCWKPIGYGLDIFPPMTAMGKASLSTDLDTLKELVRVYTSHPQIHILEQFYLISRQKTLISTYIEGILGGGSKNKEPKYFETKDGYYLFTSYNQTVTATGRLSSSKPNLQNWPREGTFPIRRCIVSRFTGGSIASADASQIELRYGGWYYDDGNMRRDFENGVDIHGALAALAYGKDYSDENRTNSKSVVFRVMYRGGPHGILIDPKIPIYDLDEIKNIIEAIYGRYQQLKEGQEKDYYEVRGSAIPPQTIGSLCTVTGRRYRFDITRFNLKNKVANYPIQSGATADFIPCAMIVCHRRMKEEGLQSLMIGQVHDDIIFDIYPGEEERMEIIANWALTEGGREEFNKRFDLNFNFPLESSWKIKKHW